MRSFSLYVVLLCVLAVPGLTSRAQSPAQQEPFVSPGLQAPAWAKTLPKDVYPESGNRVPLPKREELDDFAKWQYDHFIASPDLPKGIHMIGPHAFELYSPLLSRSLSDMRGYLRRRTATGQYDARLSELIILVTARELDNQFQWAEHAVIGLTREGVGLEQEIIDIVKYRKPLTGLGEKEATIIQLGRETLGKRKLSSDTFARALKVFGKQGLVNIVSLMGVYAMQDVLLIAFDQQVRPGRTELLPIP